VQLLGEQNAIAQPREGIVGRSMGQVLLGSDPPADVHVGGHCPTGRSPDWGDARVEPSANGRGGAGVFPIVLDGLAREYGLETREHFLSILAAALCGPSTDVQVVDAYPGGFGPTTVIERKHAPDPVHGDDGSQAVENRRGVRQGIQDFRGKARYYEHARS